MKIAIISDSHDDLSALEVAVAKANDANCSLMLHAGDLIAPTAVVKLSAFNGDVKFIIGNNDHEHIGLMRKSMATDNVEFIYSGAGGHCYETKVDGLRIFMHHYPRIAEIAAHSGLFDLCVHGHTHVYREQQIGETLLLNPGAVTKQGDASSFVIFDTNNQSVTKVDL